MANYSVKILLLTETAKKFKNVDEPVAVHLKRLVWSATENNIRSFLFDCTDCKEDYDKKE